MSRTKLFSRTLEYQIKQGSVFFVSCAMDFFRHLLSSGHGFVMYFRAKCIEYLIVLNTFQIFMHTSGSLQILRARGRVCTLFIQTSNFRTLRFYILQIRSNTSGSLHILHILRCAGTTAVLSVTYEGWYSWRNEWVAKKRFFSRSVRSLSLGPC